MITFYGTDGHSIPQTLAPGFTSGAADSFTFNIGDIGTFTAFKILNTGNDGWWPVTIDMAGDYGTVSWAFDRWMDGNGSNQNAPHSDYFFMDGTTASDSAGSISLTDVQVACPAESAACLADANCVAEATAALADPATVTASSSPLTIALMGCVTAAQAGR